MCSTILVHIQVSEIGLKLQGSVQLPFLKTGTTVACFQTSGKVPWSRDAWNINARVGTISQLTSFRKRAGRLSGP